MGAVAIVGYGTVKKSDLTGSVTAIRPGRISKGVTTNARDMITGKIAGANVISGGTPGGGAMVHTCGGSSLNAKNNPLIVIDGLAMNSNDVQSLTNPLVVVNPSDIETFTVLEGASAIAIYGSYVSNGVTIIATKKGKASSKPQISYEDNVSTGVLQKIIDVMDVNELKGYVSKPYNEGNAPNPFGEVNTD